MSRYRVFHVIGHQEQGYCEHVFGPFLKAQRFFYSKSNLCPFLCTHRSPCPLGFQKAEKAKNILTAVLFLMLNDVKNPVIFKLKENIYELSKNRYTSS